MAATAQDDRIADLVVQRRLLTQAQVEECRNIQGRAPQPCTLAQVIVSKRYATPDALRQLVGAGSSTSSGVAVVPVGAAIGSSIGSAQGSGVGPSPFASAPGTSPFAPGGFGPGGGPSSSQAGGPRATASGPAVRATGSFTAPARPGEDADVGFGRFLIAQGLLTADQAREAYRLLKTYKATHPQVTLSHVLAKHGMGDKERLRAAFQQFSAQAPGGPAASSAGRAPAPATAPTKGSNEPRFGFKTVELDPQDRPDARPFFPGDPGGSQLAPAAFAPAPFAAPPDQGGLDAFLPLDEPRPFVEGETLVDRPKATRPTAGYGSAAASPAGFGSNAGPSPLALGPNGTHAARGTNPGTNPGLGFGPGQTRGETKGGDSRGGPGGPRATHREPGSTGGGGLAVQLPAPRVPLPGEGGTDDVDDGADGDHEATDVHDSSLGAKKKRAAAASAARRGPPLALVVGGAALVVIVVGGGLWFGLSLRRLGLAKREFLGAIGTESAEASLHRRDGLPEKLLKDPDVAAALEKLETTVRKAAARRAAEAELAKLPQARTPDERVAICGAAIQADDTFAAAYVARARAKHAQARRMGLERAQDRARQALMQECMNDLQRATECDSSSPLAYLARAQVYLVSQSDQASRDHAAEDLQRAIQQDPDGALGALAQGLLDFTKRRLDPAIESLGKSIERDPKLLDAYLARAQVRLRKSDFAGALTDATAAYRMDAMSADALTLQSEARYFASSNKRGQQSGDRAGALADLDKALKLDPANAHALALRAHVRLERDRIGDLVSGKDDQEASRQDATLALQVDPEQPLAYVTLAEIDQAQGNSATAIDNANKAIEKGRHLTMVFLVRGRLRARDNDEQALSDFEEVLRIEPQNARALVNKATMLVSRREFENARAFLDSAIVADPELPEAYFQRALIALKQGQKPNYVDAVRDLSEAINLKPQFPDAYFYRAAAEYDQGQHEDCLKDLERAEAQRTAASGGGFFNLRDLYLMRGHAYFARQDWKLAEAAYGKYRELAPVGTQAMTIVLHNLETIKQKLGGDAPPAPQGPNK